MYPSSTTDETRRAASTEQLRDAAREAKEVVTSNARERDHHAHILERAGHLLSEDAARKERNDHDACAEAVTRWNDHLIRCENELTRRGDEAAEAEAHRWQTLTEAEALLNEQGYTGAALAVRNARKGLHPQEAGREVPHDAEDKQTPPDED